MKRGKRTIRLLLKLNLYFNRLIMVRDNSVDIESPFGRREISWLVVIIGLGLGLRIYCVSDRSLWFDESFCWAITQFSIKEMVERVARDNHPPFFFLVLKAWTSLFGESIASMRGLSVAGGVAAIIGMYFFMRKACTPSVKTKRAVAYHVQTALVTAILIAVSVAQIHWSRELRMYALGTALAAFSSWQMFCVIERPYLIRHWVALGVLNLLFVYTHYFALFSILAQLIFLLGYAMVQVRWHLTDFARNHLVWATAGAMAIVAVGFLPWLPVLAAQRAQVVEDFWTQPLSHRQFVDAAHVLFIGSNLSTPNLWPWPGVLTLLGILPVLGLLWRPRAVEWYLLLACVVPIICACLLTASGTRVFHPRYLVFAHLFLLASIAVLVCRISIKEVRAAAVLILVLNGLVIDLDRWTYLDIKNRPGGRAAVAFLDEHRSAGEPVITCSPLLHYSLLYYSHDRSNWYVHSTPEDPWKHYQGKPLLKDGDQLSDQQIEQIEADYVWVLRGWLQRHVPIPETWNEVRQNSFPEAYRFQGMTTVTQYRTGASVDD